MLGCERMQAVEHRALPLACLALLRTSTAPSQPSRLQVWRPAEGFGIRLDCGNAYPGATEVCGGGDEDCDNLIDEQGASGCSAYFEDTDLDGFGEPGTQICLCGPQGLNSTKKGNKTIS